MRILRRLLPFVLLGLGAMPAWATPAAANGLETTFSPHTPASTVTVDHAAWDGLLKRYVRPSANGLNRIDYRSFKSDSHKALKEYVNNLERVDVAKLDRPEQFAFWANLYNSKTIDVVLDHYPTRSIKDINLGGGLFASLTGGPWKAKVVKVGSHELSLDDIEHVIMRGIFKDHRVHFAVNCASVGCPNVAGEALTGAKLDQQLEANGKAFVNSPRGVKVVGGKQLHASKIFSWFQADFGGSEKGVLEHLKRYANPALAERLAAVARIDDYFYDWNLNDAQE